MNEREKMLLIADMPGIDEKVVESLKKAGILTLEDFKLTDIQKISESTGLKIELLRESILRAELAVHHIPQEIAEAFIASEIIDHVSELRAFEAAKIRESISPHLTEEEMKTENLEIIDELMAKIPIMTQDEQISRTTHEEDYFATHLDEDVPAQYAETPEMTKSDIETLIVQLEDVYQSALTNLRLDLETESKSIGLAELQELLFSLQVGIQRITEETVEKKDPSATLVRWETRAETLNDEDEDVEKKVHAITQKIEALDKQLADFKHRRVLSSEILSQAAADEDEPVPVRGE
ncbi:MAG: hypothetical protein ACFFER_04115 [Candidatus Thorarchaeota archaeon]